MVNWLVAWSLRNRALVVAAAIALTLWGAWAVARTPIDAIPDLSDNQVIVFTDWPGHSPQEVEDQVTYPLTTNLQGLPGVRAVRSQSAFGFSMIYVIFEDDADLYFSRTRVLERMNLVGRMLPDGVVPTLGPDATGVGHVFWYTLESPTHSLRELRTIQDWFVRYQLASTPGVAEVAGVGGHIQQYQIDLDPNRLRTYQISTREVIEAVQASNANVAGNVLESSGAWTIVRGVGLIGSAEDVADIVVGANEGVPVYVRDLGRVQIGNAFRVSSLVKGSSEVVGGVVVARAGTNAREVIANVKARIAEITPGLPAGVKLVPFYDRSVLIDAAVNTLRVALLEEMALVTLAHIVFLMHFRSILIVTIPLPLAVIASFIGLYYMGITANIMSLAGIAIAIGVLVDAGIVVTENVFRTVEQRGVDPRDRAAVWRVVLDATRVVSRPVFFSMVIILLAFAPVFALTGQEGKLFHPLAWSKTFAVLAATLLAITIVPVLCTWLVGGRVHSEDANPVMRVLRRMYQPVLEAALRHQMATVVVAAVIFGGALYVASRIGSEFMPPLNEGDFLLMPVADPSISLNENIEIAKRQNAALEKFPEVQWAVAKIARADTSTDPAPLNMTETIIHLKPPSEWRPGVTLDSLRAQLSEAAQVPGVTNIWTMPIINRIDMLSTGVRSEVGVKVFGADLPTVERLAHDIANVLRSVPGATNVYAERVTTGQYLNIRPSRELAARYGIPVGAIQEVIQHAIGETTLTVTIEGRQRFPVRVRYAPEFRSDADALGRVLVTGPTGVQVPLTAVATLEHAAGPAMISSENGLLISTVLLNVRDRDIGGFVQEATQAIANSVKLPPGYFVSWSGRYEAQAHARQRLQIVIPLVVLVIFIVLYITYNSALEAAHVILAVPFALSGGVYLLWLLGYNFSVAVWVGFIALFGTAVQTAVVMVVYLEEAVARKYEVLGGKMTRAALRDAVVEGALLRLRPKVMTVATVVAGLLPLMWSTRPGAEVMRPLATPVLGGMVSSLAHVLVVTPVLFYWLRARRIPATAEDAAAEGAGAGGTLRRPLIWAALAAGVLVTAAVLMQQGRPFSGADGSGPPPDAIQLASANVGDLTVTASAPPGGLTQAGVLLLEFRSGGELVDVGQVEVAPSMAMPGMVMTADVEVTRSESGRYVVRGQYAMAGAWQLDVHWTGPRGRGNTRFDVNVQ